jgi:polysaccharide export outer membrane protein
MNRIATFIGSMILLLTAVVATTAAAQEYRVQPGDTLRIEVIEDTSLNRLALVSPDGRISLPGAGAVRVSGRTIEQIQISLTSQLEPSFVNTPTVFVAIEQLAARTPVTPRVTSIFVVGEANSVGRVELEPGTTLLQAFAQFGGFTNFAATTRIQLHRGSEIYNINYDAIIAGQSTNGAVELREGDVIIIPQRRLFE